MPYEIHKESDGFAIYNKDKQKVVGHSNTKSDAEASIRARYAGENGG